MLDEHRFKKYGWCDFYRGKNDSNPYNVLLEISDPVLTHCFVDTILASLL